MQGSQALLLFPIYDAREVRANRQRFRRDALRALERANSFYCPAGRWPSRGWILLTRFALNSLNKYSRSLQLNIGDTTSSGNVGPLGNLSIVQAQCVTRGLAADLGALYLVELTDNRGVLCNQWFSFPTVSAYNIRAPAYPSTDRGGTFYPESMNGGVSPRTTWTWNTMVGDLWTQMGTFLGAYPGLPYAPDGTPEGFWFPGMPAWTALCDILDHLGMTVAVNHQSATPYTIVSCGAADAAFSTMQALYRPSLEDDLEWLDVGAGRVPATIVVMFRRRGSVYGTEETVTYGDNNIAKQWTMPNAAICYVSVSVADITTAFTGAMGTHHVWSDFTVRYDHNNVVDPNDVAFATVLARQRATEYLGRIDPAAYMSQTYAGARPFVTGSRVDGVRWFQDYSGQDRQGWKTQIVHGPNPPWPDLWDK